MQLVVMLFVLLTGFAASVFSSEGNTYAGAPLKKRMQDPKDSLTNALTFAMQVLNNVSRSQYVEELENVLNASEERISPWADGIFYRFNLHTSENNCLKKNNSCVQLQQLNDPTEETPSFGIKNQGRFYAPFTASLDGIPSLGKTVKIEGVAMTFPETVYVYIRSHSGPFLWYAPLCIRIDYTEEHTKIDFYHFSDGKVSEKENKGSAKIIDLGKPFSIEIVFQDEQFDIIINGNKFNYASHIPYEGATHVEVSALAAITNIEGILPVFQRGLVEAPATPLVLPIHDLPLSHEKGRIIGLGGNVLPAADKFSIRLQNSDNLDTFTAVLINLSFNFKDKGLMVNHYHQGAWSEGEWNPDVQWFRPGREKGQPFYIEFHFKANSILCVFHGDWSVEYKIDSPLSSATHLVITGDLQLNRVTGLNVIQECNTSVLSLDGKMWAGDTTCGNNYKLSYARFGNIVGA